MEESKNSVTVKSQKATAALRELAVNGKAAKVGAENLSMVSDTLDTVPHWSNRIFNKEKPLGDKEATELKGSIRECRIAVEKIIKKHREDIKLPIKDVLEEDSLWSDVNVGAVGAMKDLENTLKSAATEKETAMEQKFGGGPANSDDEALEGFLNTVNRISIPAFKNLKINFAIEAIYLEFNINCREALKNPDKFLV